jgi:hypothetical protein
VKLPTFKLQVRQYTRLPKFQIHNGYTGVALRNNVVLQIIDVSAGLYADLEWLEILAVHSKP